MQKQPILAPQTSNHELVRHCLSIQLDRWAKESTRVSLREVGAFLACSDEDLEHCVSSPLDDLKPIPGHLRGTLAGLVAEYRLEPTLESGRDLRDLYSA